MEIFPPARMAPFEQVEPGDLFIYLDGQEPCYALKTKRSGASQSTMVLLGPTFIPGVAESFLVNWHAAKVLSFGKKFSILPPLAPASWSSMGPSRTPVCLAIAGEDAYICTNGGGSPQNFFPCFVDVKTGVVFEGRAPSAAVFTNAWEIVAAGGVHPPRSMLKYPLS